MIQELEDFLTAEWIVVADACAIFAGYVPLDPYVADYYYTDRSRSYKRISDGKQCQPDYKEISRIERKWKQSDWQIPTRHPNVIDQDLLAEQVRVRDAFRVAFSMRNKRVEPLYDLAVEEGLLPREPSKSPFEEAKEIAKDTYKKARSSNVEPKPKFVINEKKKPRKEITRIQVRFFKILRDNGNVIPEPYDFFRWLAVNKDTSPFIKITEVTVNYAYYYDKKATNAERRLKHDTELVQATINRYCKAIKTKSS